MFLNYGAVNLSTTELFLTFMKIVHLIDYFQPSIGYQETFLARHQQKSGHDVLVVTSDRYLNFPGYDTFYSRLLGKRFVGAGIRTESGIKTIRLTSWEIPGSPVIFLKDLEKTIADFAPDLVLCHGIYSLTAYRIAGIRSKASFRVIFDSHAASFNTDFNSSWSKKAYHYLFLNKMAPKIINHADKIFVIGEDEQNFLCQDLHLTKSKVMIIRLGVDTELFKPMIYSGRQVRKALKLGINELVIIYTGKITRNKDVHILVEALRQINDKITLLLIGDGQEKYLTEIKKPLRSMKVIHLSFLSNEQLPKYYSAADLAVWPGDSTIAILEAMSCGLPVILPEWYGTAYLDKSGGVVRFRRKDVRELANRIRQLSNIEKRKFMGVQARQFIQKNLSWDIISGQVLQLLE